MATTFLWEGRTRTGELKKGTFVAEDEQTVTELLRQQAIAVTRVRPKPAEIKLPQLGSGVSGKDLVIFTRQLATMIDAGLPLVQCMNILATQTENKRFGEKLMDIKNSVEQGSTFSDALKRHPKVFDDLYVNLVAAGEVGGILDTILNRLSVHLEKAQGLARQVKGAMVYPIAILVVAVGVLGIMLVKVIPAFEKMFAEFGAKAALPKPTVLVIGMSHMVVNNLHFILLGMAAASALFTFWVRTPGGRYLFDAALLRMPLVGPVLRRMVVARFSRTLGTLLSSGVPILDAMDIVAKTSGNKVVEKGVLYVRGKLQEGKSMAEPLGEASVFPPMVVQMIGVGEATGAMDNMLQKIADFYEDEVDAAVKAMTSLIEPIMMVFLGGICGGMIIAMYLPIFELAGAITQGSK